MFKTKIMLPQQKAEQIFKEYYNNLTDVLTNDEASEFAFVCSIVCVNEILETLSCSITCVDVTIKSNLELIEYWKEVRDELHLISEKQ